LWRVPVFHSFVAPSALHETTMFPSGEMAPAHTSPMAAHRTSSLNVAASQILTVRSGTVVANVLPSAA
jgi:hypothetical protein